jgi:hypothetical protein
MRVSIGFAAGFFVAFLVTILAPKGITGNQIEAIWTVAISPGFINQGIWYRERGLVLGGSLSIAATLISLPFAPTFFPVGWIVLGCAVAVSGFYRALRTESLLKAFLLVSTLRWEASSGYFQFIFQQVIFLH